MIRWNAEQVSGYAHALARWPATLQVDLPGLGTVLFCHATPRNEDEIFTRITPEERLLAVFAGIDAAVVVCGHTHMPFDRMVGATRVVNAGSVGMPFGRQGADWLLLGGDIQLRHTTYDVAAAAGAIAATSCPQAPELFGRYLLQPPSEVDMLTAYEAVAVG
jgi:diadenosine tetraphosphatase ApaH/serine/threonine PP2A family protein phosphatase